MLPPASAIQNVVLDSAKSMQLACAGQSNRFGFPDCSINAMQNLGAALHFVPPGHSVWIQNRQPEPRTMDKRMTYYHGLPASRLLDICKYGLAACLAQAMILWKPHGVSQYLEITVPSLGMLVITQFQPAHSLTRLK